MTRRIGSRPFPGILPRATRLLISGVPLALLGACNADKTLTTPLAATPPDSVAPIDPTKFPPLVGQIAFVSTRDGSPYIFVAAADGSSLRRLTKGISPEWSSDAKQIVFNGADSAGDASIHIINADGTGEHVLAVSGGGPSLSPDGRRIAFSAALGLYVANSDGSNPTLLVRRDFEAPEGCGVWGAAWSPDGTRIAFVSACTNWVDWDQPPAVYVANVDGSGIIGTVQPGSFPRWSPDGSMIAFGTQAFDYFPGNGPHNPGLPKSAVAFAKPDGSNLRLIDTGTLVADEADWSPDGRGLLLIANTKSGLRSFVTDTSFRTTKLLLPDAPTGRVYEDYDAVWSRVSR